MIYFTTVAISYLMNPIENHEALRSATNTCARAEFTSLVTYQRQEITAEQSAITQELYELNALRTDVANRRVERFNNGPLAGLLNDRTNEVSIAAAEANIRDRQRLLDGRLQLVGMRADVLRAQIETFLLSCPAG